MIIKLHAYEFADRIAGEGFSRAGAHALFEFLEDCDPEMEFDRVAIRSNWSEYSSALEAAQKRLGWKAAPDQEEEEELEVAAFRALLDRAMVLKFNGGVIISAF